VNRGRLRISPLDLVVGGLLLLGGIYIAYRITAGMQYNWSWGTIPQYLFRHDPERGWVPNLLIQGFFTTIRLSVWGTALALLIGMVMGLFRVAKRPFFRLIGGIYVGVIRNLPPLVLIFIGYYFISSQIMPLLGVETWVRNAPEWVQSVLSTLVTDPRHLSAFLSALVTLALFEGAYITEIVRSGIQSVERGQLEAASALGLNRFQRMRHVIMPQAARIALPPLAGQFISTIKDSAIVSVISIQDLTFQGMELMAATYLTFEVWITVTALYLVLTLTCSLAVERLELRMGRRPA
jgi:polar amino acid transport system permease protein